MVDAGQPARGAIRLNWGLALMLALTAGFATIPRLGDEPVEGWGTGAAAFAIFPFGVVVVMCAKAILEGAGATATVIEPPDGCPRGAVVGRV